MNVVSYDCPACSAPLKFNVDAQNWKCDYCKKIYNIDEVMSYINRKENIKSNHLHGYACDNCGASVVTYDDNISTTCAYCGSTVIMKDRIDGEYKPDLIAPFKHNKEEIIEHFLKNYINRTMCSSLFFDRKNIKSVVGIYIPFFIVSADVTATVRGDARVDKNKRSVFVRKGSMSLQNVPADAKTKLPNNFFRGLEPFKYDELKPFEYPYLSGFYAERFDDNKEAVLNEQIISRIGDASRKKIMKSGKRYLNYDIVAQDINVTCTGFKYALMPIWCIHMNYHGKDYIYYVNDQNLIIAGIYPLSPVKTILSFLAMILFAVILFKCLIALSSSAAKLAIFFVIPVSWIIYLNVLLSYKNVKHHIRNIDYIKDETFILLESSDNYY